MQSRKILVYGYGNPGRQDDGLGILFAQAVEELAIKKGWTHVRTENNYQLNIEDAAEIASEDRVIFADASMENIRQFRLDELKPSAAVEFTMHAVHPAFVLHLCQSIYDKIPEAKLLHIKGYEWEFREGLSSEAKKNLDAALEFILNSGLLDS